jgi:uncharacterized protein (TIGR03437 family)
MARIRAAGWIVAVVGCALPGYAQFAQQGNKLAPVGANASGVGASVALSADGTTAAVGGPNDAGGAGAVWVYIRSNGSWVLQSKVVGTGADGLAGQGSAVALSADGNTLAVGGSNDHGGTGAVWMFTRASGVWTQQGTKLWGTVLSGISWQGLSVGLSADGNTMIEGGEKFNNLAGAAWVFTRNSSGVWSLAPPPLPITGAVGTSLQGASVALSADGTTAAIGGPGDNSGTGAVWVFSLINGNWIQQAKLTGGLATANAAAGSAAALSNDGNTLMVGGDGDGNNAGAVWFFTRTNNQWSQQGGKLTGFAAAYLGTSVALSGDGNTALAGGPGGLASTFGRTPAIGATWVFARSGGAWSQQGTPLVGTGTSGNDALEGTSVALTGDGVTAFIGGPTDSGNAGSVWVFAKPAAQSPPAITTQPASQSIFNGQNATLTVVAVGPGPLSYQWYQGQKSDTSAPVGTNSPTYTTPIMSATTSYWVRVTNPFGTVDSNTATVTVPANGPVVTLVSNAATRSLVVAPNTWVQILGVNLSRAGDARSWQTSDFVNNQLPTQLDGVSVTVNGKSAYVSYISPTQVNILTPPDAVQGTVAVQLTSGGVPAAPFTVAAQTTSPTFFLIGGPYVAAEHANGSYLGPPSLYPGVTTPAKPGEIVVLYGNGFGATTVPVVSGSLMQSGTLPGALTVTIGGAPAQVQYAGLGAFPGEYQFNVMVPASAADGDNPVVATYNGQSTQAGVLLTVQH